MIFPLDISLFLQHEAFVAHTVRNTWIPVNYRRDLTFTHTELHLPFLSLFH